MGQMKEVLRGKLVALSASKKKMQRAYTSGDSTPEGYRTKRSKYTQDEEIAGNYQTQS